MLDGGVARGLYIGATGAVVISITLYHPPLCRVKEANTVQAWLTWVATNNKRGGAALSPQTAGPPPFTSGTLVSLLV